MNINSDIDKKSYALGFKDGYKQGLTEQGMKLTSEFAQEIKEELTKKQEIDIVFKHMLNAQAFENSFQEQ